MKTTIRHGVFETNSSSSHSLTLAEGEARDFSLVSEICKSGIFPVTIDRHYGWEWEQLHRPESKMAYLVTQAAGFDSLERFVGQGDIALVLREENPRVGALLSAVEAALGVRVEIEVCSDFVGVDHDSQGVGSELFFDADKLIDFLLTPGAFVQLGNDNGAPPEYMNSDLGTPVHAYPQHFRPTPEAEGRVDFRLLIGQKTDIILDRPGAAPLAVSPRWDGASEIANSLSDLDILKAHIILHKDDMIIFPGEMEDRGAKARTALHHLVSTLREGDSDDVFMAPEIEVTHEEREVPSLYGRYPADFILDCRATPEAIDRIHTGLVEIRRASRAQRAKRERV